MLFSVPFTKCSSFFSEVLPSFFLFLGALFLTVLISLESILLIEALFKSSAIFCATKSFLSESTVPAYCFCYVVQLQIFLERKTSLS